METGDLYFKKVNEDGSHGEPIAWKGVRVLEFTEVNRDEISDALGRALGRENVIHSFEPMSFDLRIPPRTWLEGIMEQCKREYERNKCEEGCSTCKNVIRMYRYPDYVTAEEYECTEGLKCDTMCGTVKNCPKYVERNFGEKTAYNPDLDKYYYVMR